MRRPKTVSEALVALSAAEERYERARRRSESVTPGGLVGYDTAILSGTTRRRNQKRESGRHAAYDEEAKAARALAAAIDDLRVAEDSERREAAIRAARDSVTEEAIRSAGFVRTRHGWHRVVRVNAKSVSVETGYSWVDRIPFEKILATAAKEAA